MQPTENTKSAFRRMTRIKRRFEILEKDKRQLMDRIRGLSHEMYLQQPHPKRWSIGQIAQHLYTTELMSLKYLKKKLSYPEAVPPYHPKSWLGILYIRLIFLTGYKVKAPSAINMWKATNIMNATELDAQWTQLRTELMAFIRVHDAQFGRHRAFRHAFAGRMTMHQMLIFFHDHFVHHRKQIDRILHFSQIRTDN